jgi:hypothetical protein
MKTRENKDKCKLTNRGAEKSFITNTHKLGVRSEVEQAESVHSRSGDAASWLLGGRSCSGSSCCCIAFVTVHMANLEETSHWVYDADHDLAHTKTNNACNGLCQIN